MRPLHVIKAITFITGLLGIKISYAQLPDYHVQVFDESVGIHANIMRSLVIDKKDFLWMMYEDRVQRYDGHENKEFVLDNNKLLSICCDEKNCIWVNSNHHIFCISNDRKGFTEIAYDTIPGITFGQFVQQKNLPLRLLTNHGFYQLNASANRFVFLKENVIQNLFQKNFITRWKCLSVYNNTIFFASADSLYAYNTSTKNISSLGCSSIFSINALNEKKAIVSTWGDSSYLYNFQQHTITFVSIATASGTDNTFFRIGGIQEIKPGHWLASSNQGMLEYNDTTSQFHALRLYSKGSLLQKTISPGNIYLDAKQNIWMVCDFGLVSFPLFRKQIGLIRNYATYATSLWGNDVRNFTEDSQGNLWVATYGSFYCWNIASGIIKPYFPVQGAKDILNFRSIRGIAYDGKYIILGPTDLGMWLFDPVHQTYCRPSYLHDSSGADTKKGIESDFINQVYALKNGNHLVIARDADYLLTAKTYILQKLNLPFSKENLISYFAYQDSNMHIWIGTINGLYCFDSTLQFLFKVSQQNSSNIFMSMCEWAPQKYLIGTGGGQGLFWLQLNSNKYSLNKITNAFDHNGNINIVYKDSTNKIWLGTQNGLYRFNPYNNTADEFDYTDNVQGASYNTNAFYKYKSGIVLMGGQNGINYFVPEAIQQRKDSLQVSIMRLAVNGNDSLYNNFNSRLHFKYFQNSIEVDYVAPYYFNPHKIKYRYLLEGINKQWVNNNSNTSCYFTLVPPGKYTFHIAASINGINWFESKDKLSLIISTPFWQTWWFYLLCTIMVAAIIYFFYRMRINQLKHELYLRTKIARDLHDDVGSTLSSLHLVSALAKKKLTDDPDKAKELLEKIKESSERMTGNMQDIVWAVNPLNDSFSEVTARMQKFAAQMLELKNIELIFNADEKIKSIKVPLQYRSDLFMLFKEAVNNLAKYSDAKHAWITLNKSNKTFLLEIEDDGIGFDTQKILHGNGLSNMQERAKNLNGKLTVLSSDNGTIITLAFNA